MLFTRLLFTHAFQRHTSLGRSHHKNRLTTNNHVEEVENSSGPYQPGGTFQVSTALNFLYDIRDFELVTNNDFKHIM
jgi:hypothetical protein